MLTHTQSGMATPGASRAPSFDAAVCVAPEPDTALVWHDAFVLADGRIVAFAGTSDPPTAAALAYALRATYGGDAPPTGAGPLVQASAALIAAHAAAAVVALVEADGAAVTYLSVGGAVPFARFGDGRVAPLPGGVPGTETAGCGPTEVRLDLRGAALLLLCSARGPADDANAAFRVAAALRELPSRAARPAQWLANRLTAMRPEAAALLALRFPLAAAEEPPTGPPMRWSAAWAFPTSGDGASRARGAFVAALTSKGDWGRRIDVAAAELIFGEMLGNVVRHAPGSVEIVLDWTAELPVLHVLDRGPGFASRRERGQLPADEWSEGGRGLFVIDAIAVEFSAHNRPGGGTHACATLPPE